MLRIITIILQQPFIQMWLFYSILSEIREMFSVTDCLIKLHHILKKGLKPQTLKVLLTRSASVVLIPNLLHLTYIWFCGNMCLYTESGEHLIWFSFRIVHIIPIILFQFSLFIHYNVVQNAHKVFWTNWSPIIT